MALDDTEPWAEGAEEHRGKRLLPHIIDFYAHHEPDRVFAAISMSENVPDGFHDITMKAMAEAVDNMAWWLDRTLNKVPKKHRTLAYIGVTDIRYTILLLAAIKCGWTTVFISPHNPAILNMGLLQQVEVHALLHANFMRSTAKSLQKLDPSLTCKEVPPLVDLLKPQSPPYRFNGSFAELKDQTCLILHSSGSTGPPKLVHFTHAALSCTDNDPKVPVPEGRRPQNAAQFDFDSPGRFYSCFPPYHMGGVQAFILLPAFSSTATTVMGPAMMPPSGFLVNEVMKQQDIRALFLPPSIIEQWATDPAAFEQAKKLDFVLYSGGALAQSVGNKLDEITDVCQMYGSLEMGHIQMLIPQPGEWEYLEINPYEECDIQEVDEGIFEMVLHADKKFVGKRTLAHTFPDVKTWRTKDLFVPHPSKSGLWRFHSRTDDIIVLSSGHKIWPIPMETQLAGDPRISGALMVGNGRPEVLLLVEPRPDSPSNRMSKNEFIDSIWPTVAQSNSIAPEYGKVRRSRIILSQPNLGFFRAPKGTISRKPTESLYAEFIAGAFIDGTTDEESEIGILEKHWMDEAKRFIGSIVHDIRPDTTLKESDDLFLAGAMDSLAVVELGQQLRLGLLRRMDKEKNTVKFWMRTIYENPTIDDLAKAILDAVFGQVEPHTEPSQAVEVESVLEEFTSQLPEPNEQRPKVPLPADGINIVLLGSRGRLGPFIVKDLLDNPRVAQIKCLDRGTFGEVSFQCRVDELGLDIDAKDLRLQFVSVDLSQPSLNLPQEQLDEIYKNVNVIIHSAWTVDSALSLPSFKPDMLKSVGAIIDMANTAQSRPRVVFMSSISTVQEWARTVSPNVAVPEEVIKCSTAVSPTGYAQSKHVAERLLATAATKLQIPVSILRLGQITGPTTMGDRGKWESHDWLHSVAKLSKASGIVPTDMGPMDWIPVDQMAHIIQELSLQEEQRDPDVEVYNLVHPRPIPFSKFTSALQGCIFSPRQFSFVDWVQHLENIKPNELSKEAETEKIRSLPFFQALVDETSSNITIEKSTIASPTMATMEPINQELLEKWCQQWI